MTNVIIGDNNLALEGAERAAADIGISSAARKALHGEANDAGRALAEYMCEITDERVCVVAGGEPVVTVRGVGKGGRAQQCALAMGIELSQIGRGRQSESLALVAGTDGIDGPTDAAGAFASPDTVADGERAERQRRDRLGAQRLIQFFQRVGRTVRHGAERDQRQRHFRRAGELLIQTPARRAAGVTPAPSESAKMRAARYLTKGFRQSKTVSGGWLKRHIRLIWLHAENLCRNAFLTTI